MIQSWFWPLARKYRASRRLQKKSRPRTTCLRLEALEDRTVTTAVPFGADVSLITFAASDRTIMVFRSGIADGANQILIRQSMNAGDASMFAGGLDALIVDLQNFGKPSTPAFNASAFTGGMVGNAGGAMMFDLPPGGTGAGGTQNVIRIGKVTLDFVANDGAASDLSATNRTEVDASSIVPAQSPANPIAPEIVRADPNATAQTPSAAVRDASAQTPPPAAVVVPARPEGAGTQPPNRADAGNVARDEARTDSPDHQAATMVRAPLAQAAQSGQENDEQPVIRNGGPLPQELPDSSLLQRFVANHEEAAFTALVQRHQQLVLGTCQRVLGDSYAAEDAVQATFLVLARKAGLLDNRSPLSGWLCTVAYRLALRIRTVAARNRKRERAAIGGRHAKSAAESSAEFERRELHRVLYEELQLLPEKYRLPLVLCYLDGRTHVEAAEQIGLPRGSMAKRIAEALGVLRNRLIARGLDF